MHSWSINNMTGRGIAKKRTASGKPISVGRIENPETQNFTFQNKIPTKSVENLYLDVPTADVHFVFELENLRVPAHKNMLAVASDVFKTMFYGDLPEKGDVKIVDANANIFKLFLQFFYLSRVNLTQANVAEVLGLGHKYNVTICIEICVNFMKTKLNNDNVCRGYGVAILYDLNDLKHVCEQKIARNTIDVFKSSSFLESNRSVLDNILKMKTMLCSEKDVFEACIAWTKNASKQNDLTREIVQNLLGDLFYEIRFRSMNIIEFSTLSLEYGHIFSSDEYREIVHMIGCPGFEPTLFNKTARNSRPILPIRRYGICRERRNALKVISDSSESSESSNSSDSTDSSDSSDEN